MNEARMVNDARRAWYCRPGAEEVGLVICDLGTPWCTVDHNEDSELEEMFSYSVSKSSSSSIPTYVLSAMTRLADKGARVKYAATSDDGWYISYESKEGFHRYRDVKESDETKPKIDHYERVISKIREQKPSVDESSDSEAKRSMAITIILVWSFAVLMAWVAATL